MKSPRVALDTNVLVTFLLSGNSHSAAAKCLDRIGAEVWTQVSSTATWIEYEDVLRRPELGLDAAKVTEFLDALAAMLEWHHATPARVRANDPDDQLWLDLLAGAKATGLVTYNVRDFRNALAAGYPVMRPAEALRVL